ncbi:MAG: chitobiase/beta-hexosaminidase C-terminal domain-containing protein [Lachnospiraceae bacterium]|nr:chitobiase/beta-hexosaminidase C-terminal domain-containing protein [Lachnospiraceae bacterium]
MKCPNCGMELAEGKLYCEQCGEDIHIVPDFEPEVELTMEESLGQVLENAFVKTEEKVPSKKKRKKRKKRRHSRLNIAVTILILFSIGFIIFAFYFMEHSESFQIGRGHHFYEEGNLTRAAYNYKKAIELNPENIQTKLSLAYCFRDMGEYPAFEELLNEIIFSPNVTENDQNLAYKQLISHFLSQNDYEKIDKILTSCNNEYVVKNYSDYLVWEPELSHSGGYYNEIIPLKISCKTKGTIYYTLDGSNPTTSSQVYAGENIFLRDGQEYTVKAMVVSSYGVISDCVTAKYEIEVQKPSAPLVYPLSGEYMVSEPIIVDVEDYEVVYYTTDGSVPTTSSQRYRNSLMMNKGYTLYRFIKVDENGVASDYTEREYIVMMMEASPMEAN